MRESRAQGTPGQFSSAKAPSFFAASFQTTLDGVVDHTVPHELRGVQVLSVLLDSSDVFENIFESLQRVLEGTHCLNGDFVSHSGFEGCLFAEVYLGVQQFRKAKLKADHVEGGEQARFVETCEETNIGIRRRITACD